MSLVIGAVIGGIATLDSCESSKNKNLPGLEDPAG